mmetsp:Transcript_13811/g.28121  ORF Transcript_13811/g.28121 Transcript_13811/m.28121 type:complete len:89 (+) Transcript_13811:1274-1540(+)
MGNRNTLSNCANTRLERLVYSGASRYFWCALFETQKQDPNYYATYACFDFRVRFTHLNNCCSTAYGQSSTIIHFTAHIHALKITGMSC